MVSQLCLMCGSTLNCQTLCLGTRPRYNLVVDEDVKKPTNQPTSIIQFEIISNSVFLRPRMQLINCGIFTLCLSWCLSQEEKKIIIIYLFISFFSFFISTIFFSYTILLRAALISRFVFKIV